MDSPKGKRIVIPHMCDFEDLVAFGPGYCKMVYVPKCDECKKETLWNIGKIKEFTSSDSYAAKDKYFN